jgi:hypothetical protein
MGKRKDTNGGGAPPGSAPASTRPYTHTREMTTQNTTVDIDHI